MIGGRHFLDVVPDAYNSSSFGRLVIQYHGYGMSKEWMRNISGNLEMEADNKTIFFYPHAAYQTWQQTENGIDVQFFDQMIEYAKQKYCIGKVYVTGYGDGAFFVNWLITQRRADISAMAYVAGGTETTIRIPSIGIHGRNDKIVPYSVGDRTRYNYASNNGCSEVWLAPDLYGCIRPAACRVFDTVWCSWDGSHEWPRKFDEAIWDLFEHY
jgi:poly(3-hydroxybutyrate) depolymerase